MKHIPKFAFLSLLCWSCQNSSSSTLKVAASSVPHAQILEVVKPEMMKEGIYLDIIVIDDYQLPNRLLAEKQVDANFFQHRPFLDKEISDFGYNLTVITPVHIEPLGIYSQKIEDFSQLSHKDSIAIPSDPTNELRALRLLEKAQLIKLKPSASQYATIFDIEENPLCLNIKEIDGPLLPRILSDVAIAVVPGNFALQGGIDPHQALLLENKDSLYGNVLVVRSDDIERKDLKLLSSLITSEKVHKFIEESYHGQIQPIKP